MHEGQDGFSRLVIVIALLMVVALVIVGFFVLQKQHHAVLSADDIAKRLDCNRMTANVKETDVFCENPKFYNNPNGVTRDDYYKYLSCDERLKGEPPTESAKTNDPGYYSAYYDCKDEAKLEKMRLDFIKELQRLKAENR